MGVGFIDDGQVTAVILKDGSRLAADIVVVGIGIRPNVDLFEGQLAIEKEGIRVNGKLQSVSNSSVYAVGDVAAFPICMYGGDVRRLEHVDHARKSAAHAARAIMSTKTVEDYDYLPYFYSRVFTVSWQFYGDNVGVCVPFGDQSAGRFGAYWVHKGRLVGVFFEGGSKSEYASLAIAARERPHVKDLELLRREGLSFALDVAEPLSRMSLMSSITSADSHLLLAKPSTWMLQSGGGLAIGMAIVGFVYWLGRSKKTFR